MKKLINYFFLGKEESKINLDLESYFNLNPDKYVDINIKTINEKFDRKLKEEINVNGEIFNF